MRWRTLVVFLCLASSSICAQDLEGIQIHGFATQGFLFSSNNNYLSMKSSQGSLQWTNGGVSFIDSLSDHLRVGIQLHMYQLGDLGGSYYSSGLGVGRLQGQRVSRGRRTWT
jgi:hypothetical protein